MLKKFTEVSSSDVIIYKAYDTTEKITYINITSQIGIKYINGCEAFRNISYNLNNNKFIPENTFWDIAFEYFPNCDIFSKIDMAKSVGEKLPHFRYIVGDSGCDWHFIKYDNNVWATNTTSLSSGYKNYSEKRSQGIQKRQKNLIVFE